MSTKFTVNIEHELTEEDLLTLFVNIMEANPMSAFWARSDDYDPSEGVGWGATLYPYDEAEYDYPDGFPFPRLNRMALLRALDAFAKNHPQRFLNEIVNGNDDAETSDALAQYAVLGEYPYG